MTSYANLTAQLLNLSSLDPATTELPATAENPLFPPPRRAVNYDNLTINFRRTQPHLLFRGSIRIEWAPSTSSPPLSNRLHLPHLPLGSTTTEVPGNGPASSRALLTTPMVSNPRAKGKPNAPGQTPQIENRKLKIEKSKPRLPTHSSNHVTVPTPL